MMFFDSHPLPRKICSKTLISANTQTSLQYSLCGHTRCYSRWEEGPYLSMNVSTLGSMFSNCLYTLSTFPHSFLEGLLGPSPPN